MTLSRGRLLLASALAVLFLGACTDAAVTTDSNASTAGNAPPSPDPTATSPTDTATPSSQPPATEADPAVPPPTQPPASPGLRVLTQDGSQVESGGVVAAGSLIDIAAGADTFAPGASVEFSFGTLFPFSATAESDGGVATIVVEVPSDGSGCHTITGDDGRGGTASTDVCIGDGAP